MLLLEVLIKSCSYKLTIMLSQSPVLFKNNYLNFHLSVHQCNMLDKTMKWYGIRPRGEQMRLCISCGIYICFTCV